MVSITRRKPGPVRWFTLRIAFWSGRLNVTKIYPPGFLGAIGTIHAARWVTIPGTRELVFFSNYGGSWESYLEDFITQAHEGLTAVWSNTIGFPRGEQSVPGGRHRRRAVQALRPGEHACRPVSGTAPIPTSTPTRSAPMPNRRGLAAALTNDEAGAVARSVRLGGRGPPPSWRRSQIQSLVFGGLGFMPHGTCLLFDLPGDEARARAFVAAALSRTAFGDGRKLRRDAVLTVALGAARAASGSACPNECVERLPAGLPRRHGHRRRGRGSSATPATDAPENWRWGRRAKRRRAARLRRDRGGRRAAGAARSAPRRPPRTAWPQPYRIPLVPAKKPSIEPFGFVDGVSQPVIRGTDQGNRSNDPIHLVQPGEFVIGYPDNRGNLPPQPELSPLADPRNLLPLADGSRAFGTAVVERRARSRATAPSSSSASSSRTSTRSTLIARSRRSPSPPGCPSPMRSMRISSRPSCSGGGRTAPRSSAILIIPTAGRRPQGAQGHGARAGPARAGPAAGIPEPETARPETAPAAATPIPAPTEPSSRQDNDFLYGIEDPQALRCPVGAHIRRGNPRDTLLPGSLEQVAISNRHRIRRVGRLYQEGPGEKPGLLFMCLNGDIERQFEFVQQTWLANSGFQGLDRQQDPLINDRARDRPAI